MILPRTETRWTRRRWNWFLVALSIVCLSFWVQGAGWLVGGRPAIGWTWLVIAAGFTAAIVYVWRHERTKVPPD
jgi:hypothetical protein